MKKRFLSSTCYMAILLCLGVVLFSEHVSAIEPQVLDAQANRVKMINKVRPSVVAIFGPAGGGGGSGVLISPDGYALTNFHVTKGAGDYMRCGLNDGKLYDAVIVGIDPSGDVALIKLLGRKDFPVSSMGDSDLLKAGDSVYAMGNPFLLATDYNPTVTFGIVSGMHRYQYPSGNAFLEYADCIQTDASINPGNSGGPLFNTKGEVIGINGRGSFEKRGRVNSGAGYAISINQIKHFLDHLKSGRVVDHATLGASVRTSEDGRIVIDAVLESSEAYRRGLREGDEIISFAGRPVGTVNQFKNVLGTYPNGWKVPLTYRGNEGQKTKKIIVRLQPLHHQMDLLEAAGKGPAKDKKKVLKRKLGGKKLSKEYAHMLVNKEGYMNWYFNEQAQIPLIKGLKSWGDFTHVKGKWEFDLVLTNGTKATLKANDIDASFSILDKNYLFQASEFEDNFDPPNSNGLLQAIFQLRRLLTEGEKGFVTFEYLGSEPLDGVGEKVNVLHTLYGQANCRWYFDKKTNALVGFDTNLSRSEDPCSIRFGKTKTIDQLQLPVEWTVTVGDNLYDKLTIRNFTLSKAKPAPKAEK